MKRSSREDEIAAKRRKGSNRQNFLRIFVPSAPFRGQEFLAKESDSDGQQLSASLGQRFHKTPPVQVIFEDGFLLVAAIHHMTNRPEILHAQRSRHPNWLIASGRQSASRAFSTFTLTQLWRRVNPRDVEEASPEAVSALKSHD